MNTVQRPQAARGGSGRRRVALGDDPGLEDLMAGPTGRRRGQRPKDIGTAAETAVVRYLREHGWPGAERRALHGSQDLGDITGTPCLAWEVKGGKAAQTAAPGMVETWLEQTETERANADADVGVLVMQRKGYGPARAGNWWAILPLNVMISTVEMEAHHVWMPLATACRWLRFAGYGDRL